MMSMAAVALAGTFTSCSKDTELYDPAAAQNQVVLNYQQAFIKVFGQPASNHDWGFGDALTRAVNVNGNMWEEIPEVTEAEKTLVFNYVNYTRPGMKEAGHKYSETAPENLVTYWVTQVWTGTDKYGSYDSPNNQNVLGSEHMNHLQIGEDNTATIDEDGNLVGNWFHVNNFNAGDNANYGGNTLIENSGCTDFAYHCTEDSKYHNKWIIVDGADIDVSLAGYYYVCFDFVAVNKNAYTNFQAPGYGNVEVPGAWKSVEEAVAAGAKAKRYTNWPEYEWISVESTWTIGNVVNGNQVIPANDVYTDWIVRITKATPAEDEPGNGNVSGDPKEPQIRVMAEDLSANDASDFDFNDVVFDVYYGDAGKAYVQVVAAGGTLPLYIYKNETEKVEVHSLYGQPTNVMINTGAADKGLNGVEITPTDAQIIVLDFAVNSRSDAKNIKITVEKEVKEGDQLVTTEFVLEAEQGQAACKFAVPFGLPYAKERQNVNDVFNFGQWVQAPNIQLVAAE